MKITYTVDSNGVISSEFNKAPINIKKFDARKKDLEEVLRKIILNLEDEYPSINENSAVYMIQPYYITDRILFFTKTQLTKDSNVIKNLNDATYKCGSEEEEDYLKSIVSEEDDNGTKNWWYIEVLSLTLRRNLYDCEWIEAGMTIPLSYHTVFKNISDSIMPNVDYNHENGLDKRYYISEKDGSPFDYENIKAVSKRAIECMGYSQIDETLYHLIRQYSKDVGISDKDRFSNDKQLSILVAKGKIDTKVLYNLYETIKRYLNELYPDTIDKVKYNGNTVYFPYEEKLQTIYLSASLYGTADISFVLNGNVINGTQKFLEALRNKSIYEKNEWFDNEIVPLLNEEQQNNSRDEKGE